MNEMASGSGTIDILMGIPSGEKIPSNSKRRPVAGTPASTFSLRRV